MHSFTETSFVCSILHRQIIFRMCQEILVSSLKMIFLKQLPTLFFCDSYKCTFIHFSSCMCRINSVSFFPRVFLHEAETMSPLFLRNSLTIMTCILWKGSIFLFVFEFKGFFFHLSRQITTPFCFVFSREYTTENSCWSIFFYASSYELCLSFSGEILIFEKILTVS